MDRKCQVGQDHETGDNTGGSAPTVGGEQDADNDDRGGERRRYQREVQTDDTEQQRRERIERHLGCPERVERQRPAVEEQVPVSERLAFEDQRGLVRAGELSVQGGDVEDQDEDYPSDG